MANQLESRLIIAGFDRTKAAFLAATRNARTFGTAVRTASAGMTRDLKSAYKQVHALDKSVLGLRDSLKLLGTLTVVGGTIRIGQALMEATRRLDDLGEAASQMHVAGQKIRVFQGIVKQSGVDAAQALDDLNTAQVRLAEVHAHKGKAYSFLKATNEDLLNVIESAPNATKAFNRMIQGIAQANPEMGKKLAEVFFGDKRIATAFSGKSENDIAAMVKEMQGLLGNISDAELQQINTFSDNVDKWQLSIQSVFDRSAAKFAVTMDPFVVQMTDWIKANRELIASGFIDALKMFARGAISLAGEINAIRKSAVFQWLDQHAQDPNKAAGDAGVSTRRFLQRQGLIGFNAREQGINSEMGERGYGTLLEPRRGGTIMAPNSTIVIPNGRKIGVGDQPGLSAPHYRYFRPEGLASGGPVSRGTTTWVGEKGPELVNFGKDATVIPARDSQRLAMYSFARAVTAPFQGLTGAISDLAGKISRLTELLAGGRAGSPGGGGFSPGGGSAGGMPMYKGIGGRPVPRGHHPAMSNAPQMMGTGGKSGGPFLSNAPMSASERNALGLILKYESHGQNIMNYAGRRQGLDPRTAKGYTAQGYYQMLNSNWRRLAPALGIKTPNAMASSFEDQTKVGLALMRESGIGNWANFNPALRTALMRGEQAKGQFAISPAMPATRPAPEPSVVRHEIGEGKLAIEIEAKNARVTGVKSSRMENVATTIGVDNSGNTRWKPGMQP